MVIALSVLVVGLALGGSEVEDGTNTSVVRVTGVEDSVIAGLSSKATCSSMPGKNNNGHNLKEVKPIYSPSDCCDECAKTWGCVGYTHLTEWHECWLKDRIDAPVDDSTATSGSLGPSPPGPSPGPAPGPPARAMRKGWNLGNTLDFTTGQQPRAEWVFQSVKEQGFDWVRIPVMWGARTSAWAPYRIETSFMAEVKQTVDWALSKGLTVMVNAHHEDWLDTNYWGGASRFKSIWTQIAQAFEAYSSASLVFEIMNEPLHMSVDQLNAMNAAILPAIRAVSPTRLVHLGGLRQMHPTWILENPNAMTIARDAHLAVTFHMYDPWSTCGDHPTSSTFSNADADLIHSRVSQMADWAKTRGVRLSYNEFGCTTMQSNQDSRHAEYRAATDAAKLHGVPYAIWDDNGWWQTLNRNNRQWDEGVLQSLE